ncbi:MAG: SpoIIE family protein phosphatase [Spirochaetota bacterium]
MLRLIHSILFLLFLSLPLCADAIKLEETKVLVKPGFSQSWASEDIQTVDWQVAQLPILLHKYKQSPQQQTVELSAIFQFSMPEKIEQNSLYALYLRWLGENWEIYLNGKKIHSSQAQLTEKTLQRDRTVNRKKIYFSSALLQKDNNRLLIRLFASTNNRYGGIRYRGGNFITTAQELNSRKWQYVRISLNFLYFFIGIYNLLLFFQRSKEKSYLFFGLFTICLCCHNFTRTELFYSYELPFSLIKRLEFAFIFCVSPVHLFFVESLYYKRFSKLSWCNLVFCCMLFVGNLFYIYPESMWLIRIWQYNAILVMIANIYIILKNYRTNRQVSSIILFGFSFLAVTALHDIIFSMLRISYNDFNDIGFLGYICSIVILLSIRYSNAKKEVEILNTTLEEKVIHRTKKLNESLNEIQNLKLKQDEDYYLIAELVKPFSHTLVSHPYCKIEYILEQKKKFAHREKQHEIGGDICLSQTIRLNQKEYLVFVNGDAMGKSILGSAGALVLSIQFNSFINHTKDRQILPEDWLRDCIAEIEKIFQIFDGYMLASAIIGLLDLQEGKLYYINLEHPDICLYRDKIASFLKEQNRMYKFGSPFQEKLQKISPLHLKKGDCIFLGSDGKDDLQKNNAMLPPNPDRFLSIVETTNGAMEEIHKSLHGSYELVDDLSVVKISYLGDKQI